MKKDVFITEVLDIFLCKSSSSTEAFYLKRDIKYEVK